MTLSVVCFIFSDDVHMLMMMKTQSIPHADKLVDDGAPAQQGYAAWKDARVTKALAQSQDRSVMIDGEEVWKQLGCDD